MNQRRRNTSSRRQPETRTKTVSSAIGTLIRDARVSAKMSKECVAKYLEISPSILDAYESGARSIPLSHIYALSNCLNISPAVILKTISKFV